MRMRSGLSGRGVLAAAAVVLAAGVGLYFAFGGGGWLSREIAPPDEAVELRHTDPALIAYDELRAIPTGLDRPRGLAVGPRDRIYVAGDRKVRVFDKGGAEVSDFPTGVVGKCVAVGQDGKVYVGAGSSVEVHDPSGRLLASWDSPGPKAMICSIALGEQDVFLADDHSASVLRCDPNGRFVGRIGRPDPNGDIPGIILRSPHFDVAVGPQGRLWVANAGRLRVEGYTFDGRLVAAWGRAAQQIDGFNGCCNPKDLAFLPDGRFVTSEKGFPRVKVYDAAGRFVSVVAGPESFDQAVAYLDLAVDGDGRVLVLDPQARTVRVFVPKADLPGAATAGSRSP
ncbi:MAG TPA: hypothetical protein VNA25_12505 [Phycisphaerae bacterium]|nr:hypothetical protein [Phycisphaerae bacterium]